MGSMWGNWKRGAWMERGQRTAMEETWAGDPPHSTCIHWVTPVEVRSQSWGPYQQRVDFALDKL